MTRVRSLLVLSMLWIGGYPRRHTLPPDAFARATAMIAARSHI